VSIPRFSFIAKQLLFISISASLVLTGCGGSTPDHISTKPRGFQPAPVDNVIFFDGMRKEYSILKTNTGFSVTKGANSQNHNNATTFQFKDMRVNLSIGETSKMVSAENLRSILELYLAFFNRIPDADGLAYWLRESKRGMSIDEMSENFYRAALMYPSLTKFTPNMDTTDFVRAIYRNVLGREGLSAPTNEEVDYWTLEIKKGNRTRGGVVRAMVNSAQTFKDDPTWGWVPKLLNNRVSVARLFAVEQGISFNTPEDSISQGMLIAQAVTSSNTSKAISMFGFTDTNFDLTANGASIEFIAVKNIINKHCLICHNDEVSNGGIALDRDVLIRDYAGSIYSTTIIKKSMPRGGGLTTEEMSSISKWIATGAN
jgi:hypothetical protein